MVIPDQSSRRPLPRRAYSVDSSTVVSSRFTRECRYGCRSPFSCAWHFPIPSSL